MPLKALIVLVVGGIAGIAILTHLCGFSTPLRLDDATAARAAFLREYPDTRVHDATLSRDGRTALIETSEGPGLVCAMGADSCARLLRDAQAEEVSAGLLIRA